MSTVGSVTNVEMSDADAIRLSLEHDPNMFRIVFERYYETIFRYMARRQGISRADDLASEVFARAFAIRNRYDTTQPLCRPWLYGIASNIIGDEIRRQRRSQRLHLAMIGLHDESEDTFAQLDEQLSAKQQANRLNQLLARLRSGDRDILLLYGIEGLTYQEIADALDIPIGTVRSRLARARYKMRELEAALPQTDVQGTRERS